jgi:hypothetical protein
LISLWGQPGPLIFVIGYPKEKFTGYFYCIDLVRAVKDYVRAEFFLPYGGQHNHSVSYINTFHDNSTSHVIGNYGTYNFNPIDKWMEVLDENKRLYEALLKEKDEKIALLEKTVGEKEINASNTSDSNRSMT